MKVIIAGSRTITDAWAVESYLIALRKLLPFNEVVCGMAKGPDLIGKAWATKNYIPVKPFPADWQQYGGPAGYIRNEQMVKYADALVAFWDGKSKGTRHTINLALDNNLIVIVFPMTPKND